MAPAPPNANAQTAPPLLPPMFIEPVRRSIFAEPIRRVLAQVHVSVSLNFQAADFLDTQLMLFIGRAFSSRFTTYQALRDWTCRLLSEELSRWAIEAGDEIYNNSQAVIKKALEKDKKAPHIDGLSFPIEFIYNDNYFVGDKMDLDAAVFLMGVVEYLCADILKLAANYAMNQQHRTIDLNDIKSVLLLDPALQETFWRMREEHAMITLRKLEDNVARDLTLLLKVFGDSLKTLKENGHPELFVQIAAVSAAHKNVAKAMSDNNFKGIPQVLEQLVASQLVFFEYFKAFDKMARELLQWQQVPAVKKQLEERQLTKAVEHHLLRLLWKPMANIYAFYINLFRIMEFVAEDNEIMEGLKKAQVLIEKAKQAGVPFGLSVEEGDVDLRVPIWQFIDYTDIQNKIDGWQGKNIADCETSLKKEGALGCIFTENGQRKSKKPKERYFYLFDKFLVCCKLNESILSKRKYALKDLILIKNLKIVEREDSEDLKYVFELFKDKETSMILSCTSDHERRDWLAALHAVKSGSQLAYSLERILLQEAIQGPELPDEMKLTEEEYRFASPDTPDNIVFELGQSNDGIPLIKAGTVLKLVERLTYDKYADTNYMIQFLLTYRSFMSPMELLDLLIERYNLPLPKKASPEQIEDFKANVRRPVQLRVFNVVKNWVDKHFLDFKESEKLLEKFFNFLQNDMVNTEGMDKAVLAVRRTVSKRLEVQPEAATFDSASGEAPAPAGNSSYLSRPPEPIRTGVIDKITDILTLDPLEVARQMAVIEFDLYRSIKSYECLNQRWAKKNKETEAPNILAMIDRFNAVSNWVKTMIVNTEDLQTRVEVTERFIRIAEKCMELNNFNAMMEIVSGLNSISVNRLRLTWGSLSKKSLATYNETVQLMAPEKNYSNFRQALHTRQPPCIPYFGMYLTDLTFIEDGNKDFLPGTDLINFSKRRRTAAVITEIQQYQQLPYSFERIEEIQRFMRESPIHDDEECYQKSLEIEPRNVTSTAGMGQSNRDSDSVSINSTSGLVSGSTTMTRSSSFQEIDDDTQKKAVQDTKRSGSGASLPPFHRKVSATTAKLAHNISTSKSVTSALTMLKSVSSSAAQFSEKLMSATQTNASTGTMSPAIAGDRSAKTVFFTGDERNDSTPSPTSLSDRPNTLIMQDRTSRSMSDPAVEPLLSPNGTALVGPEIPTKDRSFSLPGTGEISKPLPPTPPPRDRSNTVQIAAPPSQTIQK